ncbi:hypothetical protein BQ8794_240092 [Mesorhizobium prunaredense]|uniref:Ribbon-helix-helix domain-containing protein n=3 Tax=Mesorhizobium TaxID=68287 RepID=A0A1R3V7K3_9HYPH|nr:RHH_4 domain-containing protein [Mesorhizobium escarrei]SIT55885.1 hypothetical protein BQ8794_240092 [Mesorhizobium prunaredense]SJM34673.1 hypothetical protein BQ8482_490012 [Mesorhizobium delmotii]
MCKVYARQDPEGYRQTNRSVRVAGHSTSIRLEAAFWTLLDEIAESQGLSTTKFISKLCDEALEINGDIPNFASMLRTTCALYLRGYRPSHERLKFKRSCVKARGRRWSICTCARTRICSVARPWIKRNAGQTLSLAGDSAGECLFASNRL